MTPKASKMKDHCMWRWPTFNEHSDQVSYRNKPVCDFNVNGYNFAHLNVNKL